MPDGSLSPRERREMMAQLIRPLRQWPRLQRHCCAAATLNRLLLPPLLAIQTSSQRLSVTKLPSSHRSVHFRARGLKLRDAPVSSDLEESNSSGSDADSKKSRNEKKREARRAVHWGMELASFSTPQIKRIVRVASLEREVFDALMLVKRLGSDVREGKRRQFNLIGKLLRKVQPELMDALIQATKDGDHSRLHGLSGSGTGINGDDDEEVEESEYEEQEEEEEENSIDIATRWFDGLIKKDKDITSEVYSLHSVEFDRQELRKLVRKVHSIQERQVIAGENGGEVDTALIASKKSLTRFLRLLAKQMPSE